jgi:hypothetical protein
VVSVPVEFILQAVGGQESKDEEEIRVLQKMCEMKTVEVQLFFFGRPVNI